MVGRWVGRIQFSELKRISGLSTTAFPSVPGCGDGERDGGHMDPTAAIRFYPRLYVRAGPAYFYTEAQGAEFSVILVAERSVMLLS